jgi:sugar lactone lactonase YvrE
MVCFGGADLRTLFITSARKGRPMEEQEAAVPAGSLFSVRVEVAGLAAIFLQTTAPALGAQRN